VAEVRAVAAVRVVWAAKPFIYLVNLSIPKNGIPGRKYVVIYQIE
jgi:hypothetical protein